ncbi:SKP1-like protein 21 [Rhynchospora pubera]|uniref:SKP1-like protein 21 n=1 Tax=Rhynchospora pubera TaxID=906938 RepID=A0AAV8GBE7_9POAL|nr:SKP1-like protein 21 [Rhynchospora pubera]
MIRGSQQMPESETAIIKPEAMKSYIWLQCADGSIQQVEEEVAMFCPTICREILKTGSGSSKNYAISLPEKVSPATLSLILDYCRFHQVAGRSNKERKSFDERFVKVDTDQLCELISAADSLGLKPLVDLTSRAIARMIEGRTPEEIREIFHLPDDLTEEEKLEPLKNVNDDPRIRLLNRLYARKRKELKERQKQKEAKVVEERKDERSVDELLSFINGEEGSRNSKTTKGKKKNRRRKEHNKDSSTADAYHTEKKERASMSGACTSSGNVSSSPNRNQGLREGAQDPFALKLGEDDYTDDELDPAMQEELDREVEDFARRLNSMWPDRVQEILSLGQDRRRNSSFVGHF